MVFFRQDGWIWYDHPDLAWIPVKMVSSQGGRILAKSTTNEQFDLDAKVDFAEVNPSSLSQVDNMVYMEELSEAAILHNLRIRYEENNIYTYISSILVSVNPFKMLPIYSPQVMAEYRAKLAAREQMAPHVYALADSAYKNLVADDYNQSCIISGESGAGKTEATKLVLQYMAEMSGQGSDVEQQLLEANPIIEAFGNAKTVRNNNSSRFGKWVEVNFDNKYHIIGAKIYNYLLEKSRIILPGPGERNYHLFYQLAAGVQGEEKKKWRLGHPMDYRILSMGGTWEIDGVDDVEEFQTTRRAMNVLRFVPEESENIFRTTAAVLHLGNVDFTQVGEKAQVKDLRVVQVVADLLGADPKELESALISQRKQMGRENILTFRNQVQAEAGRDALTKAVYGHLFNWLIERINKTLVPKGKTHRIVGVLDIFGFEIFETNRFEQFCINFANEKMQQHFNEHIFTMEQVEYRNENIDVAHVQHIDNQKCLDMIETGKQCILAMADEEIKLPKGSDENLLLRMHQTHASNTQYYLKPKTNAPVFFVHHYAGTVEYRIEAFMDKNKDALEVNIAEVVMHSKSRFVAGLVPADQGSKTLGSQFKAQLTLLMDTLKRTAPHFIRCIKSNMLKVADHFDGPLVTRQLRYLGLKEVVNIRQLGYPVRRLHRDFYRRYKILAPELDPGKKSDQANFADINARMLNMLKIPVLEWRIGRTKTFVKQSTQSKLEAIREQKYTKVVIRLQARVRAKIWRKRFKRYKAVEGALRQAIKGDDPNAIDKAIQEYEGLRMRVKRDLIQQAIQRRNDLINQQQAKRALEGAMMAKDVELLAAAIKESEKNKIDPNFPPLVQARRFYSELKAYIDMREQAMKNRDLNLVKQAIQVAQRLQMTGQQDKQLQAFKETLEEEEKVKESLQKAMNSRDLDALRKALEVAMSHKSGLMVGNALERAMMAGLANDPMVQQAMAMEKTLDKEVSVYKMAAELQAAINSRDYEIIASTVKLAHEKGLSNHNLTKQAEDLLAKLQRERQCFAQLNQALSTKDEKDLNNAIAAAQSEGLTSSPEYKAALGALNEVNEIKASIVKAAQSKDAGKLAEAVAQAHAMGIETREVQQAEQMTDNINNLKEVVNALSNAVQSRTVALLHSAIQKAKEKGVPENHPALTQALQVLEEVAAESDAQKLELKQAEAQLNREKRRQSMVAAGGLLRPNRPIGGLDDAKIEELFDRSAYMTSEYELSSYSELRTPNSFAAGQLFNKNKAKANLLRFTKDVIPKSLTTLDEDPKLIVKAIDLFKSVQGFMGDRHYSFPDTLVIELIDDILLWEELRDEVYLQVMKQLTGNPKTDSDLRGWMLLSLLAEFVPPHEEFLRFVLHFVDHHLNAPDVQNLLPPHVKRYAAYVLHTLKETVKKFNYIAPMRNTPEFDEAVSRKEAGKHIPYVSVDHVSSFRERSMVADEVSVCLPDSTVVKMMIHPWERNSSVVLKVAQACNIVDYEGLALFEMRGVDCQYLYPHECLLDFQNQWQKQEAKQVVQLQKKGFFASLFSKKAEEKKKEEDDDWQANPGTRRFLMKRRVFGKPVGESPDPIASTLMYTQTSKEMAVGFHNIDEPIATTLAAVTRILAESNKVQPLGPSSIPSGEGEMDVWFITQFWDCPINLQQRKVDPKRFAKNVDKIKPEIKTASMEAYMHEAKKLNTFGANFFKVSRADDNTPVKLPENIVVAINYFGIYLLDPSTRLQLDQYALLNVLGWSSSSVRVVIKVKLDQVMGSGISTATFRFNTHNPRMGKEICDLLLTYANEMMKAVGLQQQMQMQQIQQQQGM